MDLELIDRYLAGGLEGEELGNFDIRVKNDPKFSELLRLYQGAEMAVEAYGDEELRNKLRQINADIEAEGNGDEIRRDEENPPPSRPSRRWLFLVPMAAAAGILALWLIGVFGSNPGEELYAENFEAYPDRLTMMGSIGPNIADAMALYNRAEYAEALAIFTKISDSDPAYLSAQLYAGISYLSTGETQKAISALKAFDKQPEHTFYIHSRWYLALAWLKSQELEKAEKLLKELNSVDGLYQARASDMLDNLRSKD